MLARIRKLFPELLPGNINTVYFPEFSPVWAVEDQSMSVAQDVADDNLIPGIATTEEEETKNWQAKHYYNYL